MLRECSENVKFERMCEKRETGKNVEDRIGEGRAGGWVEGEEKGPSQQFQVRAKFSSFSRPSHLEILVLRLLCV